MTDWIEFGKRYITESGEETSELTRTSPSSIYGDSWVFTGLVGRDGQLCYWDAKGKGSSLGIDLMDEVETPIGNVKETNSMDKHELDMAFLYDTKLEAVGARAKFSNIDLAHAMTEEFGEIIKALLDQKQKKKVISEEIYKECVQAAAMAMRLATEGDPNFPDYVPPKGE